ncbi:MAG: hopanoid biosynthesis-associated RND transporter HpnN, partial [Beijerinckiaceae bacterium]
LAEITQTRAVVAMGLSATDAGADPAGAASLRRLDQALALLAAASPDLYTRGEIALTAGIEPMLARLRSIFEAAPITLSDVPTEIRDDWVSADGRARLEILPREDMTDPDAMRRFVRAVSALAPGTTGAPVTIIESGKTVVESFIIAAVLALTMITLLLYGVLRRVQDVVVTLVPLVIAVLMSLQAAVLLGIPLNFANIIALPLMCGVSVAFHIYYVIAWRQGSTEVLASSLTRAVFFSALTTATAFGSLWLSSHPGTASMGKLLTLSLFFTMLAAFVFVPAFLGAPPTRQDAQKSE